MGNPSETNVRTGNGDSPQNREELQGALDIPPASEFKRKSVRGGAASLLGQGATMALQIGSTILLARLLSPTDYGLQAMVYTLVAFLTLFRDAGLSAATIQRETLTREQISTLFWINIAVGALLSIVIIAAGPFLAAFYREPRLLWITIASSTIFLFTSFGVQHRALLDRTMQFITGAKIDVLSFTVATIIAIVMAELGCGYWSLIVQNIAIPLFSTIAVWIAMPWLPRKPRWTPELRSMVRFGGTLSLNSLVVYVAYNTEKILLGRFWGPAALGIYGRAYQLANLPVQQVTGSFGSVAFPMLARMQGDPERLRRSYLKTHSLVASVTVPVVIACALFPHDIVQIMLGPKWAAAAPVLRLLSPTVLVFALVNPLDWLLRATGRVERSLKIAFLIAPVVILGVTVGLRHGPAGVALGYSTAMILLFVPLVAWAKHGTGITTRDYWDCVKRPLIAGALAGAAAWLVHVFFSVTLAPIALLALEVILYSAVYLGLLLFAMGQKDVYLDLLGHLFRPSERSPVEV